MEPRTCTIAAVLLAAGSSRRFGAANKLLADIGGAPLVLRAAQALALSGVNELIVVTGHEAETVRIALGSLKATFVHNPHHLHGIGTSVAAGIGALPVHHAGALVVQGDMPNLDRAVIDQLIARFHACGGDRIVVPVGPDGAQGNPVLWPRRLFGALAALTGDTGGKTLIAVDAAGVECVAIGKASLFADIDTPADLKSFVPDLRQE